MTKQELIKNVAGQLEISQKDSEKIYKCSFRRN